MLSAFSTVCGIPNLVCWYKKEHPKVLLAGIAPGYGVTDTGILTKIAIIAALRLQLGGRPWHPPGLMVGTTTPFQWLYGPGPLCIIRIGLEACPGNYRPRSYRRTPSGSIRGCYSPVSPSRHTQHHRGTPPPPDRRMVQRPIEPKATMARRKTPRPMRVAGLRVATGKLSSTHASLPSGGRLRTGHNSNTPT